MRPLALIALAGCAVIPDAGTLPGYGVAHRPVTVAFLGDDDHRASFDMAITLWGAVAPGALVEVDASGPDADVIVTDGVCRDERIASAGHGKIRLHCPGDPYAMYLAYAHELGHAAFGLAHDVDHGCSIMAPHVASRDPWDDRVRHVCVTEDDARRATGGG